MIDTSVTGHRVDNGHGHNCDLLDPPVGKPQPPCPICKTALSYRFWWVYDDHLTGLTRVGGTMDACHECFHAIWAGEN